MAKPKKRCGFWLALLSCGLVWLGLYFVLPFSEPWAIITAAISSVSVSYLVGKGTAKKRIKQEKKLAEEEAAKCLYSPEIDPIVKEANRALAEMGKLYASINDKNIRMKINELMRITDKIMQNVIADPADIPQTKKFMNYYLPTTIKLLHSYDRMSSQGIEGENLDKSMKNINEMLDAAIDAFKKRLDSFFADQALDIETDIEVMNTMLSREGLSGVKDFQV